jgi:hypothetical protein
MFNIRIEKYPKGNYYVSANFGPELDCFLIDLHKKYNEYVIIKNDFIILWSSFDFREKRYRRKMRRKI